MNEITGIFGILILLAVIGLTVAAIIMPIVVIVIDSRLATVAKTLAKMERMMRHGK